MMAKSLFLCLILMLSLNEFVNGQERYDLAIENITVIDGTGAQPKLDQTVLIKNGNIAKVSPSKNLEFEAEQKIEGRGKYLIPGLIDGHAHPAPIEETFPQFIQFGVTSIMVPGCSICTDEYFAKMRAMANDHRNPSPRVFHTSQHFSMEGRHPQKTYPTPNWQHRKTIFFLDDIDSIPGYVEQVAQKPIIGIKVTIEDGPGPPIVPRIPQSYLNEIIREAGKHNLEGFAHISDNAEWAMADSAGFQNYIHFVAVDVDFERDKKLVQNLLDRDVSWVTTLMLDKSFLYPLRPEWYQSPYIQNYYDTQKVKEWTSPARKERVDRYIDILKADYGVENPTLENVSGPLAEDLKQLYDLGVNICLGTDTSNDFIFPGYSLHEEMQLMVMGANKPVDIIRMATLNNAKMLHVDHELGSIEEGKMADLIILNENPLEDIQNTLKIHSVYKNGVQQKRVDL